MRLKPLLLTCLFLLGMQNGAQAQIVAPNLDFETGTLANWNYYKGTYSGGGTYSLTSTAPIPTLHTLMGTIPGETDYYGGFPVVANGMYSLKLNKDTPNNNANAADYHVRVPSTPGSYSAVYHYAMVLEDPGHSAMDQPRFEVSVKDSATGSSLPCNTFTFVSSSTLPGFTISSVGSRPYYKPWATGSINLSPFVGKTVIVSFTATGCALGGHWGYGYVDMGGVFATSVTGCSGTTTTLTAPTDDSLFKWTDSATFTASYGTTKSVTITTPTVTTTYAVILIPYSGFGCADTMYVKLIPGSIVPHPSRDTAICFGSTVKMWGGATGSPSFTYSWLPATGLSCSTCDTTFATPPLGLNHYMISTTSGSCTETDTIDVTVYPIPAAISGTNIVCLGSSPIMSDAVTGGSWSSSATIISIGSTSGIVTGLALGTAVLTYSFSGICPVYKTVTVSPLPAPITGPSTVCIGLTVALSDASGAGTWSSSTTSVATVGSSSGVVTGIFPSTSDITFTSALTGCSVTRTETVINVPTVTGKTTLCQYTTATYGGISPGGTWSSSNPAVGTIDVATGTLYAVAPGTTTVSYTISTGCYKTMNVTVIPSPSPITGPGTVCAGGTISLSTPSSGGSWSSSSTSVATVGTGGAVTGSPTVVAPTVVTITYAFPTTCKAIYTITVSPSGMTLSGIKTVCVGLNTTLSSTSPGGVWSSGATTIATVGSSSGSVTGVAAGTALITYVIGSSCGTSFATVTVNPAPATITGIPNICAGSTNCFSDVTSGGAWSIANPSLGAIVPTTGCLTGLLAGTSTVTYKLTSTGCYATIPVTVVSKPISITGATSTCVGGTSVLSDATLGGTWTASNTNVALSGSCVVSGLVAGTATISYTVSSGCTATIVFTVNPLPAPITGITSLCTFGTTTLSDATPGGTWSSTGSVVTVSSTSGLVTAGSAPGSDMITYKLVTTGCFVTTTVTVGAAVTISGTASVCAGLATTLTGSISGGTWSSGATAVATVGSSSGIVAGIAAGTATITYVSGSGCGTAYKTVTVNPMPAPITGATSLCAGNTTTLSDAMSGGMWTSGNTAVAMAGSSSGIVAGIAAGTANITYTSVAGCEAYTTVTVLSSPSSITGSMAICAASTTSLSDATSGGVWSSGNTAVATIGSSSGVVTGVSAGTVVITYSLGAGCDIYSIMAIAPLPAPITGTATTSVGYTTTLSSPSTGGIWTSSDPSIAPVGSLTGVVTGLSAGTATITYALPTGCYVTILVTILPPPTMTGTNNTTSKLYVYPNPTSGIVNIQWMELTAKHADVIITDVVGREVFKSALTIKTLTGEQQINVKGLEGGIYIISVKGTNLNYSSKLVIEK